MKEHGVLNRCLLIYEEGLRRLATREETPPEVFQHTAGLVRTFDPGAPKKKLPAARRAAGREGSPRERRGEA